MRITNKMELPDALVKAVSRERHNKERHYSATTLLKGVAETVLMARHWDEIEVDASESIWQVFGSAVHYIFEKQTDGAFKEEAFEVKVSNSVVTGRVDCYDLENELLIDWKTASVWKVQFKDFSDWYRQGLIYAWLMKQNGLTVKRCQFIALLKDHSKSKAKYDETYPQEPVYVYQFDVTDKALEEIEKFIFEKIDALEKAEAVEDKNLEPCSAEERWATEPKYAVMKKGRKTALKLCATEEEAEQYRAEKGGDFIQFRPGEDKKCDNYCTVCPFCRYYQQKMEYDEDCENAKGERL